MDALAWFNGRCQMSVGDRIREALAGVAGEQIDWKRPVFKRGDWKNRASGDMEEAKYYGDQFGIDIEQEFYRAHDFLRRQHRAHAALTKALLAKTLVTHAECVAIWEASGD